MDGRVDWGRYEGNDVEAVVAMLVNREHPQSVRITPSKGDGGIDILDRQAATDGGDVVYQVKRYAKPLTSGQKTKVLDSFKRLFDEDARDPRWERLSVTEWHLVTPWDPSPEAFKWLEDETVRYAVKVFWNGETFVDQLAAKYPEVVDYYLHGGRSAVQEAYREAMALMSMNGSGDGVMSVPEVTERLAAALKTLDRDPHYAYELRFGHGEPPDAIKRPRLVMTCYYIDTEAQSWQAVDVLARCVASVTEKPITINGELTFGGNPEFAAVVQEWVDFGTPFTSPEGSYQGQINAPGGLGGELVNATIRTSPVADSDLGDNTELRLEVLNLAGEVLAEVKMKRIERSSGKAGLRVVLREDAGVFDITHRFNITKQTAQMSFAVSDYVGKPVAAIEPAFRFLASFRAPNSYRVSPFHVPAHQGKIAQIPPATDESHTTDLEDLAAVLAVLNALQQHTDQVLLVPDLHRYSQSQGPLWSFASEILGGGSATTRYKEDHAFHVVFERDASPPSQSFSVRVPLVIPIGDKVMSFGTMLAKLTDPQLVGKTMTEDGRTAFQFTTPDRSIRYRLDTDE